MNNGDAFIGFVEQIYLIFWPGACVVMDNGIKSKKFAQLSLLGQD